MNDTHRISTNSFHEKYSFLKFEFVNCSKFKYLPQNHLHKTFFSAETIQGWKLFVEIQYLYYVCTLLLYLKRVIVRHRVTYAQYQISML
jgi:hypothetical protein